MYRKSFQHNKILNESLTETTLHERNTEGKNMKLNNFEIKYPCISWKQGGGQGKRRFSARQPTPLPTAAETVF
jgi:hypothetical protein